MPREDRVNYMIRKIREGMNSRETAMMERIEAF